MESLARERERERECQKEEFTKLFTVIEYQNLPLQQKESVRTVKKLKFRKVSVELIE